MRDSLPTSVGGYADRMQWRKEGVDIPGATEPTLHLNDTSAETYGLYHLIVWNAAGVHTSKPVQVATPRECTPAVPMGTAVACTPGWATLCFAPHTLLLLLLLRAVPAVVSTSGPAVSVYVNEPLVLHVTARGEEDVCPTL